MWEALDEREDCRQGAGSSELRSVWWRGLVSVRESDRGSGEGAEISGGLGENPDRLGAPAMFFVAAVAGGSATVDEVAPAGVVGGELIPRMGIMGSKT